MRRSSRGQLLRVGLTAATLFCAACAGNAEQASDAAAPALDPELVKQGEVAFFDCIACHTTGKGEPHMQGPNLWGLFGAEAASKEGFPYSEALADAGITWNEETLDAWIRKPSEFVPGSQMAYVGMPDPQQRKALMAYLRAVTSPE